MAWVYAVSVLAVASLALNFYLYSRFKAAPKGGAGPGDDSRELLADIIRGIGLVEIRRIAPADVFLRSPRDRG